MYTGNFEMMYLRTHIKGTNVFFASAGRYMGKSEAFVRREMGDYNVKFRFGRLSRL